MQQLIIWWEKNVLTSARYIDNLKNTRYWGNFGNISLELDKIPCISVSSKCLGQSLVHFMGHFFMNTHICFITNT